MGLLTAAGLGVALSGASAWAEPACPSGMVLVGGQGVVGMRGDPYGVVPTAHLERVDAPERGCDAAVGSRAGASACWVQTDLVDPVVGPRPVVVKPFCIDAYPFPGMGEVYSRNGLSVWDAHQLNAMLKMPKFGNKRLCSFTEFQSAVAGLEENRRFIFGDQYRKGLCATGRIGSDPKCRNATTGVSEYGAVHSHWVVADREFVAHACDAPPCKGAGNRPLAEGTLVVAGGTNRSQTRQAPFTPHTWHDHGEPTVDACGFDGWDDQPVFCSDPGTESEASLVAWNRFRATVVKTGSMREAISNALGREICPSPE